MKSASYKFVPKHQLLLLILFAVGLNINTLFNGYVLDDCVVMTQNRLVEKGIRGIPELFSTDYVYGYSTQENVLSNPRYRPFSLIVFAFEHQVFGANPLISHFINLILFVLLVILLYRLLKFYLLRNKHELLAFVACFLFVVHPIHTEVIANVKSRDELLTFIFLISSVISLLNHTLSKHKWWLVLSHICFFLALLTKETAVTFIAIIPLIFYFFYRQTIKQSLIQTIFFAVVLFIYLGLRHNMVGFNSYPIEDVANSPYIYAIQSEAFATKVFVLWKYLALLFLPYPLSSDYGYNQIPYVGLVSFPFIFSFLICTSLVVYSFISFKSRSLLSFCILYFFITLSVGTNFIIDLGAPLAERMLFEPSLAFCIAIAAFIVEPPKKSRILSYGIFGLLVVLFSIKTIKRNMDWRSNESLILEDVTNSPDCSRLNLYACEQYILKSNNEPNDELRKEYLNKAVVYGEKSLAIHNKFAYIYQRLGFAYFNQQNYLKASELWLKASELEPNNKETKQWLVDLSTIFYKNGNAFIDKNNTEDAIKNYLKATELNSNNIAAWYSLGGSYYMKNDSMNSSKAWNKVKTLDPNFRIAKEDFSHN